MVKDMHVVFLRMGMDNRDDGGSSKALVFCGCYALKTSVGVVCG